MRVQLPLELTHLIRYLQLGRPREVPLVMRMTLRLSQLMLPLYLHHHHALGLFELLHDFVAYLDLIFGILILTLHVSLTLTRLLLLRQPQKMCQLIIFTLFFSFQTYLVGARCRSLTKI